MQADNPANNDKEKRLATQQEMIEKVIEWLRDEGYKPGDITDTNSDTTYFAKVVINERSGFHVGISTINLDSVIISEIIELNETYRKAYQHQPL